MSKKQLISGIFFFLLLLLAGNASSQVEPIYAGWAVGDSWNDGSGTRFGTILWSTDSGETWTRQGAGQIADVNLWSVFAVDPYTAWAVGDPDSGYATIYHTTDGGTTWERKGSSDPTSPDYVPDGGLGKVHAAGDDVWAVVKGAILHTSDGGTTWTNHIPSGYENIFLQGVYVLDSNTVWVTGGNKDGYATILKTTDAGQTWTRQTGGDVRFADHILGISAADAETAWAVGGDGYVLLKTIDGGTNWTQQSNGVGGLGDLNEVYAVSRSTVWVAADTNIYWTTNGGASWENSQDHGLAGYLAFMGISAVSAQKAWTTYGSSDGYGYIANTAEGGYTWSKINKLNGDDLPSLWNISFATQPIYPDYLIISMIEDVEMLVDDGILNKGQGNAIIVKLEKALDRLDDDR
jgi:photosystem II stability/assembly factor-like uncharacterized protein